MTKGKPASSQPDRERHKEPNLGQQDARREREKEREMDEMGERSDQSRSQGSGGPRKH